MTTFWLLAGLMLAVAMLFLLWPVWREHRKSGRWAFPPTAVALLAIPLAVVLYSNVTTWQADGAGAVGNPEQLAIVEQLAERMQDDPDDIEGWLLLGRSYLSLQQYVPARQAFMQAEAATIAKIDNTRELLLVWSNQEPISLISTPSVKTQTNPVDPDAR